MGWPTGTPMTHRQRLTYTAWLDLVDWETPDRTALLLQQLTAVVDNLLKGKGDKFTSPSDWRLRYDKPGKKSKGGKGSVAGETRDVVSRAAKSSWIGRVGRKPRDARGEQGGGQ